MKNRIRICRRSAGWLVFAAALQALCGAPAAAQDLPARPVRVIVPFPPGGGTDTVARPLTGKLSQLAGQQFVIDNRGGAGGTIGAAMAAKSPADGYTVGGIPRSATSDSSWAPNRAARRPSSSPTSCIAK